MQSICDSLGVERIRFAYAETSSGVNIESSDPNPPNPDPSPTSLRRPSGGSCRRGPLPYPIYEVHMLSICLNLIGAERIYSAYAETSSGVKINTLGVLKISTPDELFPGYGQRG